MEPIQIYNYPAQKRGTTIKELAFVMNTRAGEGAPLVPTDLDEFSDIIIQFRAGTKKGKLYAQFLKEDLIIDDPATGRYIVPDIDTQEWPAGVYYYDHLLRRADNLRYKCYVGGEIALDQNVSNPPKP
jgi:hypothetical protein